jgi:glutathione S-transferase
MKLYGFWRSLATYRVRVALALKGMKVEQVSINLLQGKQHTDECMKIDAFGRSQPSQQPDAPAGAGH